MYISKFEDSLNELFVKKAPAVPEGVKKFIVEYVPYLSIFGGFLSILSAYWLWQWAHAVSYLTTYYGISTPATDRMDIFVWLSLIVVIGQAIIYIRAYSPLKRRSKTGWNLLFYASLLYVLYALISVFINSYGSFGNFIGSLIGTTIGLYLLFQIRSSYLGRRSGVTEPKDHQKASNTSDK